MDVLSLNKQILSSEQVEKLWELLCPLLRTALSNITVETYNDWGTCIATSCVSTPTLELQVHPGVHVLQIIWKYDVLESE